MARYIKTRTQVLGLHPGSLVYIGESGEVERVHISLITYDQDSFYESHSATLEKCVRASKKEGKTTWIEFHGLSDKGIIEEIGNQFGIHRLWLEDVLNTDHRPKLEEMDDMLFSIIKHVIFEEKQRRGLLKYNQTSIFFGKNVVLTFHDNADDIFEPIKHRLKNSVWKIRTRKADYLFYALIDLLVDQYYVVLEKMGDYFEDLESQVINNVNRLNPVDIISLKSEFLYLRKTAYPVREALTKIINSGHTALDKRNLRYFKDVHDHTEHIIDTIDYYNELSASLMDFYQNTINRKTNEIMKVLTIFAAIFIPLTFVVGIYGMNFEFMPELKWKYGYFFVWGIFVFIGLSMLLVFKRKNWF